MGFHFENTSAVWHLAWLIPVVLLWSVWYGRNQQILRQLATSPRLLATIVRNYRSDFYITRLVLFSAGIVFLVLSLMNPVVKDEDITDSAKGISLMIAIDVSNSMLANDVSPNRLEKARTLSLRILENIGNARVGLIAFAGQAQLQMPPTSDLTAIKQAIQALSVESIPLQGTNIDEVLQIGYQSLASDLLSKKAMLIITDGEELEGAARKTTAQLAEKGLLIHVAGVGTEQGIILTEPNSSIPVTDADGSPVVTRLDAQLLSDLASISGGSFFETKDLTSSVNFWNRELKNLETISLPNKELMNYKSLAPIFLSLALMFFLWPWVFRMVPPIRKRGKLVLLTMFLMTGIVSFGQDRQAWMKDAKQLYMEGDYKAAIEKYKLAHIDRPKDEEASFYLGLSHYQSEQFEEAAEVFQKLREESKNEEIQSTVTYNAGLAFAKAGKLAEALESFKEALAKNPGDEDIIKNLQKTLMEQKKQQPPSEEKQEDKPPMREEDASRKLQSVMEEERRVRERIKPRGINPSNNKNW